MFKVNGIKYVIIEQSGCRGCCFNTETISCLSPSGRKFYCSGLERKDGKNVIFQIHHFKYGK